MILYRYLRHTRGCVAGNWAFVPFPLLTRRLWTRTRIPGLVLLSYSSSVAFFCISAVCLAKIIFNRSYQRFEKTNQGPRSSQRKQKSLKFVGLKDLEPHSLHIRLLVMLICLHLYYTGIWYSDLQMQLIQSTAINWYFFLHFVLFALFSDS